MNHVELRIGLHPPYGSLPTWDNGDGDSVILKKIPDGEQRRNATSGVVQILTFYFLQFQFVLMSFCIQMDVTWPILLHKKSLIPTMNVHNLQA